MYKVVLLQIYNMHNHSFLIKIRWWEAQGGYNSKQTIPVRLHKRASNSIYTHAKEYQEKELEHVPPKQ